MARSAWKALGVLPLAVLLLGVPAGAQTSTAALSSTLTLRQADLGSSFISMRPQVRLNGRWMSPPRWNRVAAPPTLWRLAVTVRNPTDRVLKGSVEVSSPSRFLGTVVSRMVRVAPGSRRTVTIPLPGAAVAPDQRYEFTARFVGWDGTTAERTQNLLFINGNQ